ncbi:hypothetical protein ACFQ3Z_00970 [Streptomyces nogalater]
MATDQACKAPPSYDGEPDLVDAFHVPLPATDVAELLGIPHRHHHGFRRWAGQALQAASPDQRLPRPRRTRCRPNWSWTNAASQDDPLGNLALALSAPPSRRARHSGSAPGSSAARGSVPSGAVPRTAGRRPPPYADVPVRATGAGRDVRNSTAVRRCGALLPGLPARQQGLEDEPHAAARGVHGQRAGRGCRPPPGCRR